MNEKDDKTSTEPMVEETKKQLPLSERPCGNADPEMAKWPLERKKQALPPSGSILTAGPLKGPNGWVMIPFRVTYSNASKLRISAELINYLIPVPDPPGAAPLEEGEGGRTTLAVDDGVLGAASKL